MKESHPVDFLLSNDAIPSVWCPGCGIGTIVNTFVETLEKLNVDLDKICVSSGVGCTGKIADYLKLNCCNEAHGNAIKCAVKFKLKNPEIKVVVFMNDVDFIASGADDFIEAGGKGTELLVIYINNFIYVISENKTFTMTPFTRILVDKDFNSLELPFNVPHLAKLCGAQYIARWTPLHVRRLMYSITDAFKKPGFSVIEVISPCLIYYATEDKIGETIDRMRFYHDNSVIKHGEPTENLDIRSQDKIIMGKFVDSQ
jgi:2-oxoglutarate ferredoxin oxidoreductase subunit beta